MNLKKLSLWKHKRKEGMKSNPKCNYSRWNPDSANETKSHIIKNMRPFRPLKCMAAAVAVAAAAAAAAVVATTSSSSTKTIAKTNTAQRTFLCFPLLTSLTVSLACESRPAEGRALDAPNPLHPHLTIPRGVVHTSACTQTEKYVYEDTPAARRKTIAAS